MNMVSYKTSTRYLEMIIVAFFALMLLSVIVVYIIDPSVYLQPLHLKPDPANPLPWQITSTLIFLVAFLGILSIGVLRHWRWTFWLMLITFTTAILQLPTLLLEVLGFQPLTDPFWYSLFRLIIVIIEPGLAIWMIQIYRHEGVWAMGKKKVAGNSHTQL